MNCPNCWPPYPLRKSGWESPEYFCYRCKEYFNDKREKMHDPNDPESELILEIEEEEDVWGLIEEVLAINRRKQSWASLNLLINANKRRIL